MNAKELLERFDFAGFNPQAQETILRALRLLAAAEANDGSAPETDALIRFEFTSDEQPFPAHALLAMTQWAKSLERERNGLAARVAELERMIEDARNDIGAMRERHADEMARFGCPFVNSVVSREDGHFLAHQIIDTYPAPDGLRVVIASVARSAP